MVNTQLFSLGEIFIHGRHTVGLISWFYPMGSVVNVVAYPTRGVTGAVLQVHNIGFEKSVDQNNNWQWKLTFEVENKGWNGVAANLYLSIIS